MANVVIVESPAKANTIKSYLGSNYKVVASVGHIRDLPKSSLGIDIDNNFDPKYINIRGKGDLIKELKKECKKADKIFLATDPDREGEAISWHLAKILNIDEKDAQRVTFNEITKTAVKQAIKTPRGIDMNLVDSQQARRILDRIVGYMISPFLWKNIKSGLSAGRVQSVETRLIVEREEEINAFVPEEYWTISALLRTKEKSPLISKFYGTLDVKMNLKSAEEADALVKASEKAVFTVISITKGVKQKHPSPPFITSTMQQEANRKLNFQLQRTMRVAQELYEGVNLGSALGGTQGLITYMRTDSLRISDEARDAAKEYIHSEYGEKFYPDTPRIYNSKKNSQDAHEAIRPSNMALTPAKVKKSLTTDQYKLYKLVWDRFIASQMRSALLDTVSIDVEAKDTGYIFKASGYTVQFAGFMSVYEETLDSDGNEEKDASDEKESKLPDLKEGDILDFESLSPLQHFTQPPARFTEATLIKALEEQGIGRPSTYAPTITTIIQRDYIKREGKSLKPTNLGVITTNVMKGNFATIVDYGFTAKMEDSFDEIEEGNAVYTDILKDFYSDFKITLEEAEKNIGKEEIVIEAEKLDVKCENCGENLVIKSGRFGKFAACPNYPECKVTHAIDKNGNLIEKTETEIKKTDKICELCGSEVVIRKGRFGEFYACENYPKCKYTKPVDSETNIPCPDCGKGEILKKRAKNKITFYCCSKYPDCKFSTWDIPLPEKCPKCSSLLLKKKGKQTAVCHNQSCDFTLEIADEESAEG